MSVLPKSLVRWSLLVSVLLSLHNPVLAEEGSTVSIELSGLATVQGNVYIAVYDSEDTWLGKDTVLQRKVVIADALDDDLVLAELQLPAGEYAVSIYYDINGNGDLDTNWIGIPKEPVALSNNARNRFGPPKYKDAVFTLGAETVVQKISIESI